MGNAPSRLFDRMVNLPVDLPSPTPLQLKEILLRELSGTAVEVALHSTSSFVREPSRYAFEVQELLDLSCERLGTVRSLRGWMQSLDSVFIQIQDSCNALDVLRLELIRHLSAKAYRRILEEDQVLVEYGWSDLETTSMRTVRLAIQGNREDRRSAARRIVTEFGGEAASQVITTLLAAVFPVVEHAGPEKANTQYDAMGEEYERMKRLAHPVFWERYRRGQVVRGGAADSELAALLSRLEGMEDPETNFRLIAEMILPADTGAPGSSAPRRTAQVLDYLQLYRVKIRANPRLCSALIRALGEIGGRLSVSGRENLFTSERDKAQRLLLHLLPGVSREGRLNLLLEIVRSSPSLDMVTFLGGLLDFDWRSVVGEEGFAESLGAPELSAAIISRVEEALNRRDPNVLAPGEQLFDVLTRWMALHKEEARPAARSLATEFILAVVDSVKDAAVRFRDALLPSSGEPNSSQARLVLDLDRLRKTFSEEKYQSSIKNRFGPEAHLAVHQCANWIASSLNESGEGPQ